MAALRRLPWRALTAALLLYLTLPLVYCLLVSVNGGATIETPFESGWWSLRWYGEVIGDARWAAGLGGSLQVALISVPISLISGATAALAVERGRFAGRALLSAAILSPLLVPPVVLGMQSLALHQRIGLWGSPLSIALAHSLWSTPLVFLITRSALALVPIELEQAARSLGASPLRAYWRVTLPLIAPALLVAAALSFIVSANEVVMALFLATPRTQTLPTLIWPQVRYNLTPVVAAASGTMLLITLGGLLVVWRLAALRRLIGARRVPDGHAGSAT